MKPVLQALVLAERVYEDKSGKKIICGTFNGLLIGRLSLPEHETSGGSKITLVPGGIDPGCPSVYISLTDVVDGTKLNLQFVNMTKNKVLFQTGLTINVKDRLLTVEIVAPLPPLARYVTEPGTFSLDVLCDNEILGSHRLLVKELGQQTEGG
jgi:hypothetical protein